MRGPTPGMARAPIPAKRPIEPPPLAGARARDAPRGLRVVLVSEVSRPVLVGKKSGNVAVSDPTATKLFTTCEAWRVSLRMHMTALFMVISLSAIS